MLIFFLFIPLLTFRIALSCGTPIPATSLVVQIDPGPIPTFIIFTPNFIKNLAASAVATFPAHNEIFLGFIFIIFFMTSATFSV